MNRPNPFNRHAVDYYREELALWQQERERAYERCMEERDLADAEDNEPDDTEHVTPRDRLA